MAAAGSPAGVPPQGARGRACAMTAAAAVLAAGPAASAPTAAPRRARSALHGLPDIGQRLGALQRFGRQVDTEGALGAQQQFHARQAVETEVLVQHAGQQDRGQVGGARVQVAQGGLGDRQQCRGCRSLRPGRLRGRFDGGRVRHGQFRCLPHEAAGVPPGGPGTASCRSAARNGWPPGRCLDEHQGGGGPGRRALRGAAVSRARSRASAGAAAGG